MSRQRKPKILYVEAPDSGAGDSHEPEEKPRSKKKSRRGEHRPPPKVVEVVSADKAKEIEMQEKPSPEVVPPLAGESVASPTRPPRRPNLILSILFGAVFLTVLAAFIFIPLDKQEGAAEAPSKVFLPNCLGINPEVDWGYELHELSCRSGVVLENQSLADILLDKRVSYKEVMRLQGKVRHNGLPPIQPGNSYILLYHDSDPMHPWMMAYAPDPSGYVLLNLKGEAQAELYKLRKENSVVREMEVAIITDLAEAMFNREFGLSLAREMESALKWKLDFFHLDPGDRFSLLFRETEFEGGVKTIEGLEAVRFRHDGEEGYAFHYQDAYVNGYFDQEGRPMRSGFLQAPLEYGRISSSYNLTRRDPILNNGEIRAHLGTDYAAPTGTPILAVGDGIVLNAENKGGNGNYVKIFHTEKIQTQYLHMSAFAEGIEPGAEVQQGQVIGYVGSTGRATGPHVCFRFWKDGVQVDHRKEKFLGPSPPLRGKSMEMFEQRRDSLMRIFEPV